MATAKKTAGRTTGKAAGTKGEGMDVTRLLEGDHDAVEDLFKQFEKAQASGQDRVANEICRELTIHAQIEEQLFYPTIRAIKEVEDMVKEGIEEHAQIKDLVSDIEGMSSGDEQFEAKVTVLIEDVQHHVEEEEKEMFPKVRKEMGKERLSELGQQMAQLKEKLKAQIGASGQPRVSEPVRDEEDARLR